MKLVWRVQPEPQGHYHSFEHRGWPSATYDSPDGVCAVFLYCADDYRPSLVRSGTHAPIEIVVCHHNHPEATSAWKTFRLKVRAGTLAEAKMYAHKFLETHPDWHPKEKHNESAVPQTE